MFSEPTKETLKTMEDHMKEAIEAAKRDFAIIRTGRANPSILDRVMVEYYGDHVPVRNVATISAPEPRLLVLKPFDRTTAPAIRKAIQSSDLGLNPLVDGDLIRVPLPALTEERRRELVKEVNKKTEEKKVELRNARRDAIEEMRKLEKSHEVSEDELRRFQEQAQKLTDTYTAELDKLQKAKDKELMET
jgi:ribosome recycling factor